VSNNPKTAKSNISNWVVGLLLFFGLPIYFSWGVADGREWFNEIEPVASWCNDQLDGKPADVGKFGGASQLKNGLTDDIKRCLTEPEFRQELARSTFNADHWVNIHQKAFNRLPPRLKTIDLSMASDKVAKGLMTMSSPLKDFLDKQPPPPIICINEALSATVNLCPASPDAKNSFTAVILAQRDHQRLYKACHGWCFVEISYKTVSPGDIRLVMSFKITGKRPEDDFYQLSISEQQQSLRKAEAETQLNLARAREDGMKKPGWIPELVF